MRQTLILRMLQEDISPNWLASQNSTMVTVLKIHYQTKTDICPAKLKGNLIGWCLFFKGRRAAAMKVDEHLSFSGTFIKF